MPELVCSIPVDACGRAVVNPECKDETEDIGLGPGRKHVITTKWVSTPDASRPLPQVWLFVKNYQPYLLDSFTDGSSYTLNWDLRQTLQNGKVVFGLFFQATALETAQGFTSYWIFSNEQHAQITYGSTITTITFTDAWGSSTMDPFQELVTTGDTTLQCWASLRQFGICLYDCCPVDCTKPYDNTLFCKATYDESSFSLNAFSDPGLDKQVFLTQGSNIVPIRGIATTRSADAYDQDLKLLYGSQQWVMVWDLEANRLVDFFPKEWLRYGASMFYQQATLRKEVSAGKSSRKPYYIEVVDLGLVNTPQGSFDLDRDVFGQRSTNWDVASRLMAIGQSRQQLPPKAWGTVAPMDQQLYAEFNQVSYDAYKDITKEAVVAQRERWIADRAMFLDQTARQRFHDQVMFLTREVAEKTLRLMTDSVEQFKNLVDTFNPESQDSFGYYMLIVLNLISNKMLRTKEDLTTGPFAGTKLGTDESTSGDWMRYMYGELRRLVEITKIDKVEQANLLQAMSNLDPSDPNAASKALKAANDYAAIKQQYELAAEGEIPAGAGVTDPDTLEQNQERGLN